MYLKKKIQKQFQRLKKLLKKFFSNDKINVDRNTGDENMEVLELLIRKKKAKRVQVIYYKCLQY